MCIPNRPLKAHWIIRLLATYCASFRSGLCHDYVCVCLSSCQFRMLEMKLNCSSSWLLQSEWMSNRTASGLHRLITQQSHCAYSPARDIMLRCSWWNQHKSWLRHCATTRKVAGSMEALEFFIDNRSAPTMALGLTQPLTYISTSDISWR